MEKARIVGDAYVVQDITPRLYSGMNEPEGGMFLLSGSAIWN